MIYFDTTAIALMLLVANEC